MFLSLSTVKFFKALLSKARLKISVKTVDLNLSSELSLNTDVYYESSHYRGNILFIHGMNKYGKDDPRIIHFCSCLASIGFRVIVPTFRTISSHLLNMSIVDEFDLSIKAIAADKDLCPNGRMGIFTVSFSGTLALQAISRPTVCRLISGFFTIGSGFFVKKIFKSGLEKPDQDSYIKNICIKNVLISDPKISPKILHAIDLAIDNAFMKNNSNQLTEFLPQLTDEELDFFNRIIGPHSNSAFLYPLYENYLEGIEKQFFETKYLSNLTMPLTFMHSTHDIVFPAEETLDFCKHLRKNKVKCEVNITTFLEHVNHNFSLKKLPELLTFFYVFYKFFKSL